MSLKIKTNFGNNLLESICLNPKTLDLSIGTNKYYTEYCEDVLGLNSIKQSSNSSPFFESYLYNAGISFRSVEYANLQTLINSNGKDLYFTVQNQNNKILMQSTDSNALIKLENINKTITLNPNVLKNSSDECIIRNFGTSNNPIYFLSDKNNGYVSNLTFANSLISVQSSSANTTVLANSASYAFISPPIPYANQSYFASTAEYVAYSEYSNYSPYANSATYAYYVKTGENADLIAEVAYSNKANSAISSSYASYSDYSVSVEFSPSSSYAIYAGNALQSAQATKAGKAELVLNATASYASYATFSDYAAYSLNSDFPDFSAYASYASYGSYAPTGAYSISINQVKNSQIASYAINITGATFVGYATFANLSEKATTSTYALNAYSGSYSLIASYATTGEAIHGSYATNVLDASYAVNVSYSVDSDWASYAAKAQTTFYASLVGAYTTISDYASNASYASYGGTIVETASYAVYANQAGFVTYANRAPYTIYTFSTRNIVNTWSFINYVNYAGTYYVFAY